MKTSESRTWKCRLAAVLVYSCFFAHANAQAAGAGAAASAGAPSGSSAVESVIISAQATGELAKELSRRMCIANVTQKGYSFLLGTPPNLAAIQSYLTFKTALDQLATE